MLKSKLYKFLPVLFIIIIFFIAGFLFVADYDYKERKNIEQQIIFLEEQIKILLSKITELTIQKEISASSYLVTDLSKNSVILRKNEDKVWPIASITKLMNAVIATEKINPHQTIILTKKMLSPTGHSPSLFLNLQVSAQNLLKASLIQSTNDAAQSLAYFIGEKEFISAMNNKANELGMSNTYYYDAYGFSINNHSTAADLTKLLQYIWQNHPDILNITKDNNFSMPCQNGKMCYFKNLNTFFNPSDFMGGKTGYLPKAKQSFASIYNVNGKPMAIVLLHSENRQKDTELLFNWLKNNIIYLK